MAGLKLSRQAAIVWAAIGIMFLASATLPTRDKAQRQIRRACFAHQIDMCGDLLCESSDDSPDAILKDMYHILEGCLNNPDAIDERYYRDEEQKRILD